jgi:hypothetical protein
MIAPRKLARWIVDDIAADISGRKGIGDEYDQIDSDVKKEMIITWLDLAEAHIEKYTEEKQ